MKKIFLGVISILLSILTIVTISGCSKNDKGHKHNYSSLFNYSSYQHWHECSCGEKSEVASHTYGEFIVIKDATEESTGSKKQVCSVCGYEDIVAIPKLEHTHNYSSEFSYDSENHWYECRCRDKKDIGIHTYGEWIIIEDATEDKVGSKKQVCSVCGYEDIVVIPKLEHTHNYSSEYSYDSENHWYECICEDKKDIETHTYGEWIILENATEDKVGSKKQICSECNYENVVEIPKLDHTHNYSSEYSYDSENHWYECICEDKKDIETHNIVDGVCIICNYCKYSGGLSFTLLSNDTYQVTGIGSCKDTNLIIQDEYNGKAVTSIGYAAFRGCSNLTSVVIPNSVTSIGGYAFYSCSSLTSITIPFVGGTLDGTSNTHFGYIFGASSYSSNSDYVPSSLKEVIITGGTSIGSYAFLGCSSLESIVIPNSVTSIGEDAFSGCSSLESIVIPNSVTSIGSSAFSGCSSLVYSKYGNGYYLGNDTNPYLVLVKAKSTDITSCEINTNTKIIYSSAFYNCSSLESIVIPNSVTSIGSSAFSRCSSLEKVYYEGSIEEWCNITFSNESSNPMYYASNFYILDENGTINYNGKKYSLLTEIEIPNTITTIGKYQFYGFNNVTSITIPNSVISIGEDAFYYCSSLESIVIPNSVTSIGYAAFRGCSNLTSVVIPNSVTSIGGYAFYSCSSLTSITIPFVGGTLNGTNNTHFGYIFGADSYSYNSYYVPISLKEVIITGGTSIGYAAFSGCSNLTSVVIPNSVTSIGEYAFSGCSSLESITIPFVGVTSSDTYQYPLGYIFGTSSYTGGVATTQYYYGSSTSSTTSTTYYIPKTLKSVTVLGGYIPYGAFYNCSNIKEIVLSTDITSIGSSAFKGCGSLTSVVIPNSVMNIGSNAFEYCSSLVYSKYGNGYYLGNDTNPYLVLVMAKSTDITSCEININTKIIYLSAFRGCSSLKSVTIPEGVTSIGEYAFYECRSLTSVTIPEGVTSIGEYAFCNCSSLESIVIPNSVTSIGEYAFSSSLEKVYYEGSIEEWCNITFSNESSNPMEWAKNIYILDENGTINYNGKKYSLLTKIEIPNTITTIGKYQFYGFSNVTSITIPNSVTSIGSSAFKGCSSLESITIPFVGAILDGTENTHFGYIFGASSYSYNDDYVPISLKEVIITGGTSIAKEAFSGCSSLESITIPSSVTSIGSSAFKGCSSLTSITIPTGVISIGSSAFSGCSSLESITIPFVGVTSSDTYQYPLGYIFGTSSYTGGVATTQYYYGSSTSSTTSTTYYIPNTLKSVTVLGGNILYGAFYNCSNIKEIVLPTDITSIGSSAFKGCGSLTSVVIPNSVTNIGSNAFEYCSSLESIVIPSSVTSIGEYAFGYCRSLTSVVIPNSVTSIGANAFEYCSSLEKVYYEGSIEEWCNITFSNESSNPMEYAKNIYILDENGTINYNGKKYSLLTEIEIPNTITSIGDYQFCGINNVTSITIPSSVTSIGNYAFKGCSSLESIIIPEGVTSIGEYAFSSCSSLTSIVIPNSVTSIGSSAFEYCRSLESIVISNSVTSIGYWAFNECSGLTNVYYNGTIEDWCNISFSDYDSNPMYYASNFYILDEELGNIEYNGNKYSLLTEIEIPNTITSIGCYQFHGFNNITSIAIPSGVTSIGYEAFRGCSSLTTVYYTGTSSDWANISIDNTYSSNSYLTNATRYYYSEAKPTSVGKYWHYVDGVITIW